jgi:hypothetical protein
LEVYWATTSDWRNKEREMIEAFLRREGAMPFGNKVRGFKSMQ